jgi:hypothetical protein
VSDVDHPDAFERSHRELLKCLKLPAAIVTGGGQAHNPPKAS